MPLRTIAVTRPVSATIPECELTHLAREPIDVARATRQHQAYERLLESLGLEIVSIAAADELPDAVFVEDTAVVLDRVALLTRPGAESRRAELPAIAEALARYREVRSLAAPATLDGGDVLRLRRALYVGRSTRTNDEGIRQLRELVAPFGYSVVAVEFSGCLHLKSAVTALAEDWVLLNPAWVEASALPGCAAIAVHDTEPYAANALRIGDQVVFPAQYPRTRDLLAARGLRVATVECDELAKAEGAVTCCSLVFDP